RFRSVREPHAGERRVRVQVVELAAHVAHAVRAGFRRDLHGAQDAERAALGVDGGAARVTWDPRGRGVDLMVPAARVLRELDALLGAELADPEAQLGVPV